MKTPTTPGECRDCRQGYTKEGFAAHPDHIELCPLHSAAADLLAGAKDLFEKLPEAAMLGAKLRIAMAKAEAAPDKPKYSMATFCPVCHKSLGGTSPEGKKGFVDGSTMHVVGVETSKGAVALCGMRHDGINAVDTIEPVKLGGH
jgi:hypothetical protein